jgi:hypothetical protein
MAALVAEARTFLKAHGLGLVGYLCGGDILRLSHR